MLASTNLLAAPGARNDRVSVVWVVPA